MRSLNPGFSYRIAVALAVLLVVGVGAYALVQTVGSPEQPTPNSEEASYPAPDIALERLNGEIFRLSEHRGKIVLLNFWATWCTPCREEIPDLIELQEEMDDDILVVGISVDKEGREVVESFAEEFGINYPVVVDDGQAVEKYGPIHGIPMTFFVNREGRVRLMAAGMVSEEQLRPVLTHLIEGRSPETLEPPFFRLKEPLGQ